MKRIIHLIVIVTILVFQFYSSTFGTENRLLRSTGIGIRGSYWNPSHEMVHIKVSNFGNEVLLNTGGCGGWLLLYSRVGERTLIEFGLGGIGQVEERTESFFETESDIFAITPILMGLRYEIIADNYHGSMSPYICFGGGPYWFSEIHATEKWLEEEVTIDTKFNRGGYLGGGFMLMLNSWFAINADLRYHFIDFNVNHRYSGYEFGLGINLMWGTYTDNRSVN
ncbi:hypothetical protein JXB12_13420 [candidate division KSB1 bacterium]|nr:hypothetical protein [candidate division KSB1 bacterium]